MAISLGLLSFRKNVTRIVKDGGNEEDDDDDGWVHGGKYVPEAEARPPRPLAAVAGRGGGDVMAPSPYSMLSPPALGTPLPPEPATNRAFDVTFERGAGGGANPTPHPKERGRTPMTERLRRLLESTPAPARIADPPPLSATPAGPAAGSISADPAPGHRREERVKASPSTATPAPERSAPRKTSTPVDLTPVGRFLQESGVPVDASHTIGYAASRVSTSSFTALAAAWNWNRGVSWRNKKVGGNDLIPDVVESLFDFAVGTRQFLYKAMRILAPFLLWAAKMLIALTLMIGGTLAWGLVMLFKGRKRAKGSGAVIVQHSAIKSLRESVRNSPFFHRSDGQERLPFSGFSDGFAAPSPDAATSGGERPVNQLGGNDGDAGKLALSETSSAACVTGRQKPTASSKLTPPVSAIRSNRTKQQTPAIDRDGPPTATTPATARRVLFSETEHGEVSTELHHFDKNLPASARKVEGRGSEKGKEKGEGGDDGRRRLASLVAGGSSPRDAGGATLSSDASGLNAINSDSSTPESTILRSSKYHECRADSPEAESNCKEKTMEPDPNDSTEENDPLAPTNNAGRVGTAPAKSRTRFPNKDGGGNKEQNVTEEERKRQQHQHQQYIQRYGLLPTITPLSKRYARMKQQRQQKPLSLANCPSENTEAALGVTTAEFGATNANGHHISAKRKRRGDLLGAASRMGRNRRARLGKGSSNLPAVPFGKSRIKRRRDAGQTSFADEWVWRAMNHDGKENLKNIFTEESASKRGKFASGAKGDADSSWPSSNVVETPTKGNSTSSLLASVMTPPKTPGPPTSRFVDLGHATPGPRQTSALEVDAQTPGKPSIPTLAAAQKGAGNAGGRGTGGFSFGAEIGKAPAAASGGLGFSSSAVEAPENKSSTVATAVGEKGAASKPAFSVSNNKSGCASTFPAGGGNSATFNGGCAQPEPSQGDSRFSGTAFTFGKTTPSALRAEAAPKSVNGAKNKGAAPTASSGTIFSFEKPISSDGGATMAPASNAAAAAPTTGVFSFGPSAGNGNTVTPVTAAASTAHVSAPFSFAASSQPAASSGGTFSFGTGTTTAPAPPNFGTAPVGSTFSVGGSTGGTGGASARRRAAKANGRRR